MLTSDNELMDKRYIETPTITAGPVKNKEDLNSSTEQFSKSYATKVSTFHIK